MKLRLFSLVALLVSFAALVGLEVNRGQSVKAQGDTSTLRITSDGSWLVSGTLTPGWETVDFNDSTWDSSVAPAPDNGGWVTCPDHPDVETMWSSVQYTTIYLRKSFVIDSDSKVISATMTTGSDDDHDAYVNGTLVASDWNGVSGPYLNTDISAYLVPGKNVVAIKAHDTGGNRWMCVDSTITTLTVLFPDYKQDQGTWATDDIPKNSGICLMSSNGCAVTSVADVLAYYSYRSKGVLVDPGSLDDLLSANSGFVKGSCNIDWVALGDLLNAHVDVRYPKEDPASRLALINSALSKHQLVVISVFPPPYVFNPRDSNDPNNKLHYVVVIGNSGTDDNPDYIINDPSSKGVGYDGDQSGKPLSQTVYKGVSNLLARYYLQVIVIDPFSHIPNGLTMYGHSPIQFLVTDPSGKQTGYDPSTGAYVENIPGSTYGFEGGITDDSGQGPSTPTTLYFHIDNPSNGAYQVQVVGTGTGQYSLDVVSENGNGAPVSQTVSGATSPGETQNYIASYSDSAPPPPIQQVFDDKDPHVQLNGWRGVSNPAANGGTYRVSRVANDNVNFVFSGTSITLVGRKGPDQGKAQVFVDGVSKAIVDLYNPSAEPFQGTISKLSNKTHLLKVKVLGTKNAKSSGTNVSLDAIIVGGKTTQDDSPSIYYNSWSGAANAGASGGTLRQSKRAGAVANFTFTGTSVTWVTAKGPTYGKATVYIDNVAKGTVDLYNKAQVWQFSQTYGNLTNAQHTIKIKVLGTKNALSKDTYVVVDAFTGPITVSGNAPLIQVDPEADISDTTE
jgi:hypothetical protein